jgi:hypothetical protein
MILLVSNQETLRLTTSSSSQLDVVISYIDHSSNGFHPASSQGAIVSATTTEILGSPSSSRHRQVKQMTIRNAGASANTIILLKRVNSTSYELFPDTTLLAGEALIYNDGSGFSRWSSTGYPMNAMSATFSPTVNAMNTVVLASDVTNNNATANTLQDVTGLSFPVIAGETYWFRFGIDYTAAATTTGSRWTLNGPSTTRLSYRSLYSLTASSNTYNAYSSYQQPTSSNLSSAQTAGNQATVEGHITPSANGTLQLQFASEVSSSAIVAKVGSICQWMRVL